MSEIRLYLRSPGGGELELHPHAWERSGEWLCCRDCGDKVPVGGNIIDNPIRPCPKRKSADL